MPKISFDLNFPTDKPNRAGYVFTPESVKDIFSQIKDMPIKMLDTLGNSHPIGSITSGELSGNILKCEGELYCAPTLIEYDGKFNLVSIDIMPKFLHIPPYFEMISAAPKYKVGDHVYILRRVNDSRVISSEKIKQVHAGKHSISYSLYGETIRRKQIDIFKTYEDAQKELKRGTTI